MDRRRSRFGPCDLRRERQSRPHHPLRRRPRPRGDRDRGERIRRCGRAASPALAPHRGRDVRRFAFLAAVLLIACTAPAAAPSPTPTPTPVPVPTEKVTFMAGFKPQADLPFVAVYVAQEKGYFRDQSLEVEIQHATGGEHIQLLATNRVQFSTGSAGDVMKRVASAGVPLVSIAQIGQRDEQSFAVRADSPIRTLKDWERGLADAIVDRDAAIDVVMKYATGEDRAHQRYMLDTEIDAAQNDLTHANGIGAMDRSRYVGLRDFLLQYGGLAKSVDVDAVFTDRFIKDLYNEGRLVWR